MSKTCNIKIGEQVLTVEDDRTELLWKLLAQKKKRHN